MAEQVKDNMVTLTIDGVEVTVPEGTNVVDAARIAGQDIPVFCYHPKMDPVGMCRMCLVDVGLPMRDRATGEALLNEDGTPQVQFGRTLVTGCTQPASEGMVVVGYSEKVQKARKDVLEFFLTSHPLDCPICDKGGECPLQNLTLEHGPGESRFNYDEKKKNLKHVPLGDLIFLDRERCIQCARCTRFQSEIVDDPVIGFYNRGRNLEITTWSEPGFDSYWSGNTTDICPVGALTTADFRFGARPWEMLAVASICQECPVGCNLTLNTRREAKSGGRLVVKRVMPRQNEQVNELWICDKGRFGYHYASADDRLTTPLIRKDGAFVPASWDEALSLVADKMKAAGSGLVSVAGGQLSNEDYFNIGQLTGQLGGKAVLYSNMMGGDLTAKVGLGPGSNLADLGAGDAILVVASDLEEEAPLYWLRVKQAAERGAALIVVNPRLTKTDRYATHKIRYEYGQEAAVIMALSLGEIGDSEFADDSYKLAAKAFAEAHNAVVFFGSEGAGLAQSDALSKACANLLIATGHTGKPNNGLIGVWDKGNVQGAWDMGLQPSATLFDDLKAAKVAYVAGADLAGDDPALKMALVKAEFVVLQELHHTATMELADVVLPAQSFMEREGSITSGERRVQRYYPAVPPEGESKADFAIAAELAAKAGLELESASAGMVFLGIVGKFKDYADLDYQALAEVGEQWPLIGREDLYYGGTSYANKQGLGVLLQSAAGRGEQISVGGVEMPEIGAEGLLAVPVTRLYDQGNNMRYADVVFPRIASSYVALNPADGEGMGEVVTVELNGFHAEVALKLDHNVPQGIVLVPRSFGLPVSAPTPITVKN
ncbi:MAG: NADH-quinone oxidoreductase subunit NuoG [Anaerolineales bacterium]